MPLTLALLPAAALAADLKCGAASNDFRSCPECFQSLYKTGGLDFWWNWGTEPNVDERLFTAEESAALHQSFVPMVWGQTAPDDLSFLANGTHVMGFNEPDMYGPNCDGDWDPPAYSCTKGEWRGATSSGWKPLFDPQSAAGYWETVIGKLTSYEPRKPRTVVSPSMAQWASGDGNACVGVDPSKDGALKHCPGWLAAFKNFSLGKTCKDFSGQETNCWDVIDVIQIHAYARYPQAVTAKLQDYQKVFADDFAGTNGRKKKVLWLTEVSMGSNKIGEITKFMADLLDVSTGVRNRTLFNYVEKVSWFSNWAWDAFPLDGYTPAKNEVWSSGLYYPFGDISPLGAQFFNLCTAA